jgi:hypothetical protein
MIPELDQCTFLRGEKSHRPRYAERSDHIDQVGQSSVLSLLAVVYLGLEEMNTYIESSSTLSWQRSQAVLEEGAGV